MKINIACFFLFMFIAVAPGMPAQDQSAVKLTSVISSDTGIVVTVVVTDAVGNSKTFGHRLTMTEADLWVTDPKAVVLKIYVLAYSQLTAELKAKANIVDITKTITAPTLDDYNAYKKANP